MITDPYAPPASEEEQFREVARLLGVALHRWHKLHRGKTVASGKQSGQVLTPTQADQDPAVNQAQRDERPTSAGTMPEGIPHPANRPSP